MVVSACVAEEFENARQNFFEESAHLKRSRTHSCDHVQMWHSVALESIKVAAVAAGCTALVVAVGIAAGDVEIVVGDWIAAESTLDVERPVEIGAYEKAMVNGDIVDEEEELATENCIDGKMASEVVDVAPTAEESIVDIAVAKFVVEEYLDVVVTSAVFDHMRLAFVEEHCNGCCTCLVASEYLNS